MKRHLLIFSAVLFAIGMMAERYTIVFNSGNADSSSPTTDLNNIVLRATGNCVASVTTANKIYRAKDGYGIKGGTGSAKGELTLGLDDSYFITTMTVYAAAYLPTNGADTAATKRLVVCENEIAWEEGHRAELRPYTITLDKSITSISIASQVANNNRWYVQKIEFEAEDPHPQRGIAEMQYAKMDFGTARWEGADEPIEDVLNYEVIGRNVVGNIKLKLNKGTTFALSQSTLPASGGEVDIFYSITLKEVTTAIPYEDVLVATCTGADGIERSRELPIVLTVVKPSSSSAFSLDTTRIAFGPMPGNYYQYAQHTADSTLKNHLGYIICCGKRYRYGSGSCKSWDAFFHTDRDTMTNEVLDMYSNNHRYFDPAHPTASVTGFDIEHMLPKSWWGGDVNPAYCDIFHLVPGDNSANRSKSNHAPGIPADSSFNNGSFVTGSGAAYGLTRVFCPADEYKGDFARAYFYIATCYGDSLKWLSTGEAGTAMTNEGWQEFRSWLRDLLVEWHRMDPVSEKEKARAVEVNKIQGNRNPFIDYPELVEYIWGNKQGQAVDFKTLIQSYGDSYDETTTGIVRPFENTSARKQLRDGRIVIVRNTSIYTTLGQLIR